MINQYERQMRLKLKSFLEKEKRKLTHMCACLIGLHLFTLPMLALPSFILPRSITQLPGKYVSNRLPPAPRFHEGTENKPSSYCNFLSP